MKTRLIRFFTATLLLLSVIVSFQSCKRSSADDIKNITVNPAFREFVDGFTTGPVSTKSEIVVRLSFDAADSTMIEQQADNSLFEFNPSIKGKVIWADSRTLVFKPEEKLPAGKTYEVQFHLSMLTKVPDSLQTMVFSFHTIEQDFEVFVEKSRAYSSDDLTKEQLTGIMLTSDVADINSIQSVIEATQDGRTLPVSWTQDENKRKHTFIVDSIHRTEKSSFVKIRYHGKSIGVDKSSVIAHEVNGINDFKVTNVTTHRFPEEYILVRFSDPLKEDQEMDGKISMGKFFNYSYIINFNELFIYPASEIGNDEFLTIDASIQNINNNPLVQDYSQIVQFEDISPNVKFLSSGIILPSGNGMVIPFEAVNLKAVDVRIIQIYRNNIPQFLQVNDLSGSDQITRVGRKILQKTIPLGQVANYNKWNTFYLDISKMIQTDPGAIYNIELSFRKEHSALECNDSEDQQYEVYSFYNQSEDDADEDWEYFGYYNDWYYDDYYYDWSEREDPCSRTYYNNKKVSTNILATDIGLMAKAGDDGEMYIFATDLISAQPMKDVSVDVLNYQLQSIVQATTDSKGMCKVKTGYKPFLVIAKKDEQQSYLKISDANSLSLSSFDVSGEYVQKGMKGFIYGERGVWRPGDSLFISFILEDTKNTLPSGHPVIFELYNPLGNLIEKRSVTDHINGFYPFHTATSPDAPTGLYRLLARVGKNTFSQYLRIETIKPNRLKILLDTGKEKLISTSDPNDFSIESSWLHGAIANSLKVECDAVFQSIKTSFPKYKGFCFNDPSRFFSSDKYNFYRGQLNDKGFVSFRPIVNITDAPGFIGANIETRVYEPGGEFSIDFTTVNFSPYQSYVGIMEPKSQHNSPYLYTGRSYSFTIANVSENGKPAKSDKVQIEVYKMEWQYWWSSYESSNSEFMYYNNSELIDKAEISLQNGLGTYSMKVENDDWGRYFIKVKDTISGHSSGIIAFFDWYGYNRFTSQDKTSAAMLSISTDKSSYITGEEIKLSFKAPEGSRAYISIENGSGIIETHQVNETDNIIEFKTKARPEMAPNVYLSVNLIQPHKNTIDGLPIRLYGVVPVFVENPETKLKPAISAPEVLRPGQTANISVSEANGKAMTYTLAIVDEGLLSLTKFKTPDPHSKFYSREALGVRTWDIYHDVIGAWGGEIQRILSIGGGDEVEMDPSSQRATRFKPMVRYIGPIELGKGKMNSHSVTIPEYVGSVRIMVVAGQNKAYGNAEKTVQVKSPLMLLGTAPRVIGPGETFRLPVSVFAMEDYIKNVTISVKTNKILSVSGKNTVSLKFPKSGEQLAFFEIKASDAIGKAQIIVTATSGNEKAVWKIEMDVRAANPMMTDIIEATVREGETWEASYEALGIEGTNENALEISSFIPMNIDKWLSYLINYPHGCAEQTISGAFAMLYIDKLSDAGEQTAKKAESKVKNAIKRIQNLQLSNGGIAMWPGSNYADDWTTSYAGQFAIEAQQKGYVVTKQFINKWKSYQQNKAKNWKHNRTIYNNDLMQAYRLYTLALAGSPETGAMNRLSETPFLSPQAKWLLASAYAITGRTDMAKRLIAKSTTDIPPYYEYDYTYGSHIRDKAFMLETYIRLGMSSNALTILKEIATELGNNSWLSTQTAAQSLRAVALYLSVNPMGKQMNFTITKQNKTSDYQSKNMTHHVSLEPNNNKKIVLKNTGKGTIYARIIRKGIPKESTVPASQNNLRMTVTYTGQDGKPINPISIPQGTIFIATATVTHPGTMNNYNSMALTQIFPSGWEVMSDRFAFESTIAEKFTYQDIRDDRVITYFNLSKSKSISISVRLSASYVGTFYMPMIYCEAMYNNSVNASEAGRWVQVTGQNSNETTDATNSGK